jgi:predicted membrane protein
MMENENPHLMNEMKHLSTRLKYIIILYDFVFVFPSSNLFTSTSFFSLFSIFIQILSPKNHHHFMSTSSLLLYLEILHFEPM